MCVCARTNIVRINHRSYIYMSRLCQLRQSRPLEKKKLLRSAGTLASLLEAASLGQNGEPLDALQRQEFTLYWLLE